MYFTVLLNVSLFSPWVNVEGAESEEVRELDTLAEEQQVPSMT